MAMGPYVTKMKKYLPQGENFVMASVQLVVMNDNDDVLITKRADNGEWDFPGGGCEIEDTFKQTAVKELKEETNLDVLEEDLEFLGTMSDSEITTMYYPNDGKTKYFSTVFGIVNYSGDLKANDGEVEDFKFVTLEEVLNYNITKSTKHITQQLLNNNVPFIS